ncbi:MAG: radical SAM protein [Thermoanaerobaculales bacterium]|nr:radical SAM protein [Thermoanaerobaculales bacterium]
MMWPPSLIEPVFRPPSEASSLILQLTLGCSWNRCTYCAMYRSKDFGIRPVKEVIEEVRSAAGVPGIRRVFLADGDALAAPFEVLAEVLAEIKERLPEVQRVGIYGDSRSILKLGTERLSRLKDLGLGIIYFGPETGDEATLKAVIKGATVERQLEAARVVREAEIKLSMMALLGLAGVEGSERHARATGRFIAAAQPTYAAALTVTLVPGTEMHDVWESGAFQLPDRWGMLQELQWMLEEMEDYRGPFHANHASNYLPLKLRLPRDRESAIALIREVLESRDEGRLRPEWSRGL